MDDDAGEFPKWLKPWVCLSALSIGILLSIHPVFQFVSNSTWFKEYQTFVAGLLALLAAWWTVGAINRQIKQAEDVEQARQNSRRAAARAVLPLGLSAISQYATDCARILQNLIDKCVDETLPTKVDVPPFPAPPDGAIGSLKEMTEAAGPTERDTLADILGKTQIQWSRLSSLSNERRRHDSIIATSNLESYIIDCAELVARSSALFNYARRETEEFPSKAIYREQMTRAVKVMGLFEVEDRLIKKIDGYPKQET